MSKKISNLFSYNQFLIEKTDWKLAEEQDTLQWSKRGLVGNKKDLLLKKFFGYITSVLMLLTGIFFSKDFFSYEESIWIEILLLIFLWGIIFFFAASLYLAFLGGGIYYYRVTSINIELVSWVDGILFIKFFSLVFLGLLIIVLVIFCLIDSSLLLVNLGGVVGAGMVAGATLFSKGYIERHLKYKHMITRWDSLLKIEIDNRGKPIILIWGKDFYDKKQQIDLFNLFCTPEIFDEVVKLIQQQVKEENLEKGLHYCETWG